jgi:hypothetical protein
MTKIVNMSGEPLDADYPDADPGIARLLNDLVALNREGKVSVLSVAMIGLDGRAFIENVMRDDDVKIQLVTVIGAIEYLKLDILQAYPPEEVARGT